MNRLTSDGTYNYQYDARGNRTLRTKISDNTKTEYAWDHRNRLTGVKFKSAGGTVTKEVQYSYDAFNRLVRRRLDADGAGAGGFTDTFWVYDGEEAILEFAGGAATVPSHRYLWGPAVDQILADEQVATGSPADVRWLMTDWQGTIRVGLHERRDACQSQALSGVWKGLLGEARSPAREGPAKGGALIRRAAGLWVAPFLFGTRSQVGRSLG